MLWAEADTPDYAATSFEVIKERNLAAAELDGGTGLDTFVFDTFDTSQNADKIVDFLVTQDTLAFDNAVFSALTDGFLASGQLRIGTRALDANDHIICNRNDGRLYYDVDGIGSSKAKLVAYIGTGLALTTADVLVI
jgi:hypothetical protein